MPKVKVRKHAFVHLEQIVGGKKTLQTHGPGTELDLTDEQLKLHEHQVELIETRGKKAV